MEITIIGITDSKNYKFDNEAYNQIGKCSNFAGGIRHFELIRDVLPHGYKWFNITIPLHSFFDELRQNEGNWVVFASGDPLFFGIANTIRREFPKADINVYPTFNSLQILAHRFKLPYGDSCVVSLTGRSWEKLDKALIDGEKYISILTDKQKNPVSIAKYLLKFGFDNYQMYIGENLGGENERTKCLILSEVHEQEFSSLNCLILEKTAERIISGGIPDSDFELLPNRPLMITKMPIRAVSLALMRLRSKSVMWDIGACTGSISVEAKIINPLLQIYAFEIREESKVLITNNLRKFGAPVNFISGDFNSLDVGQLPAPDVVFLGGYGGKMNEILDKTSKYLKHEGIIAFNAVSNESRINFLHWAEMNGFTLTEHINLQVDSYNMVSIIVITNH